MTKNHILIYLMIFASSCAIQKDLKNYRSQNETAMERDFNACLIEADYHPKSTWILNDNYNRIMDACMKSKGHQVTE